MGDDGGRRGFYSVTGSLPEKPLSLSLALNNFLNNILTYLSHGLNNSTPIRPWRGSFAISADPV